MEKIFKDISEEMLPNLTKEIKALVKTPAVIILTGPVGAGKTTFTKSFIPEMGVGSPTYSIINEYESCAHADLYRIKSSEELVHLELSLYLDDKDYFLVEWGSEFLSDLKHEIDEDFTFYELKISSPTDSEMDQNRIFTLSSL